MTTMKVEAYLRLEEFQNMGVELSKADHILIANAKNQVKKSLKNIPPKAANKIWSKLKTFIKKWGIRTGWVLIGVVTYAMTDLIVSVGEVIKGIPHGISNQVRMLIQDSGETIEYISRLNADEFRDYVYGQLKLISDDQVLEIKNYVVEVMEFILSVLTTLF